VDDAPVRQAVRVLLVDPRDRVLLLHASLADGRTIWVPTGGGLEPGETSSEAVLREVYEETRILLPGPGAHVWTRTVEFSGPQALAFGRLHREEWFLTRLPAETAVTLDGNPDAVEFDTLLDHRWWSADEIDAAPEIEFVPRALGRLLRPLLLGDLPATPLPIGL